MSLDSEIISLVSPEVYKKNIIFSFKWVSNMILNLFVRSTDLFQTYMTYMTYLMTYVDNRYKNELQAEPGIYDRKQSLFSLFAFCFRLYFHPLTTHLQVYHIVLFFS